MRLLPDNDIHATLVVVFNCGLLITGPSGSGKSTLALRLVDRGHALVVDDSPIFERQGLQLLGLCPKGFEGSLYLPEQGLVNVKKRAGTSWLQRHPVGFVIRLDSGEQHAAASAFRIHGGVFPGCCLGPKLRKAEHVEALVRECFPRDN